MKANNLNVLYIHTHDSGRVFSPYGYKVPSFNIEKFATDAIVFRNAYAVAPTCSPSRGSLLTGQYPSKNGMLGLCNRGFVLQDNSKHLANYLAYHDYESVLCGIQHEAGHYNDSKEVYKNIGYQKNISTETELSTLQDKRKWDEENTNSTIDWINERSDNIPFFLSFGFFGTHRSFPMAEKNYRSNPPDGLPRTKESIADFDNYCESMNHVDHQFELIVQALKTKGYYENTLIIFTTDHGIGFPYAKSNLFDAGIGVALIIRDPRSSNKGFESHALVSQIDLFPTICDLIGIERPHWLQGKSMAQNIIATDIDHLVRENVFAEMTFHTSFEPARAVRNERYKYIEYLDESYQKINASNINQSPTKELLIDAGLLEKNKEPRMFFDLYFDPDEKNNLIDHPEYQDQINYMSQTLMDWREGNDDPLLNEFVWKKDWVVNKKESIIPSSKNPDDYIEGHGKK